MNSNNIIQLASALNQQQIVQQQQIQVLKLANDQITMQGAALIETLVNVPAATSTSGNIINTKA